MKLAHHSLLLRLARRRLLPFLLEMGVFLGENLKAK